MRIRTAGRMRATGQRPNGEKNLLLKNPLGEQMTLIFSVKGVKWPKGLDFIKCIF